MADAKRLMGRLSGHSSITALPDLSVNLDADEVRELQGFSRNDRRVTWPDYVVIAIISLLVCYLVWWGRNRLKTGGVLILAGTLIMHGCGNVQPVIRLTARFAKKVFLYKPLSGPVRASLEIRNDGNRTVRLSHVDGGCSCRKIDQSRLPASLAPGSSLVLSVGFMPQPGPPKQTFRLKFETDHGALDALAPLFALPTHGIAPPSIAMTLDEDQEDAGFDLVHRAIFRGDVPGPEVELVVPQGLTALKARSELRTVGFAKDVSYVDTVYHLTLKSNPVGLKSGVLQLKDSDGRKVLEVPFLFQRRPFLSSIPDRVVLGEQPIRVRLACPDEKVGMATVNSSPRGVIVRLTSPRELTVAA